MVTTPEAHAPAVATDLTHGGRWTSLRVAGREWLWHRADPARTSVRPGVPFIDAGGLEECIPTVRGMPDHGLAWSRPWRRIGDEDVADCAEFRLHRRVSTSPDGVLARYRVEAEPGYRFLWSAHALLDLSIGATISLPDGLQTRVYPEAAALLERPWPESAPYLVGKWPVPFGLAISHLGPDDGTAVGATVVGAQEVEVADGPHRLRMRVDAAPSVPSAVAIWRNLGGFPASHPYRSIGVEPMLGSVFNLAEAGNGEAATVPASGSLAWTLHITGSAS